MGRMGRQDGEVVGWTVVILKLRNRPDQFPSIVSRYKLLPPPTATIS